MMKKRSFTWVQKKEEDMSKPVKIENLGEVIDQLFL